MSASAPATDQFDDLVSLLRDLRIVALTGAGCSTESGIPDYRGPETRRRARNPIQYLEFVNDARARTRYWARSTIGWRRFANVAPNAGHLALARLEAEGLLEGVITQNVDGLHHAAGSRNVVELHGSLADVRCLECGCMEGRDQLQTRLLALNPGWNERRAEIAPDGDAELEPSSTRSFRVPGCQSCGGTLKPHVVFFGENVPPDVVEAAWTLFYRAEALLVVGSSLQVYSGYRFVLRAAERRLPVAILNLGPTRGDDHAWVRVDGRSGELLPRLAERLVPEP